MGVEVAKQQNDLKEQQADGPDCRDSSKPRKNDLSNQRFNLEEKKRAQKNCQPIQEICWRNPHVSPEPGEGAGEIIRSAGLHSSFFLSVRIADSEPGYSKRSTTIGSTRI